MKCGAPATVPWRKKFYWHTPWLALLVIINLLIYVIVAAVVRKQIELNVPLCDTHNADRKRYKALTILMFVGFVPVGLLLGYNVSETIGWVTGLVMFSAAIVFYFLMSLGIRPVKIDETGAIFRGACPEFLNLLPQQEV